MPYNPKQYRSAEGFALASDDNIFDVEDKVRSAVYDLYEDLYLNAAATLRVNLRGDDQTPMLVPSARKIVETTGRFLAKNPQYLIEAQGDVGTAQSLDMWWSDFWKREGMHGKLTRNKRWGLIRGDAYLYVYSRPEKAPGRRLSVAEVDPRQVFEIENPDDPMDITGVHMVEQIQDFREPDKPAKKLVQRRTFKRVFDEFGTPSGVTSELGFYELGKWDDRSVKAREILAKVANAERDEPEELLPYPITQLPLYKWSVRCMENSTWGMSILAGIETLMYGLNQGLSDEDATLVFQGLGMYVTNAPPPLDPTTQQVTDWNIGPKQIIEIGIDQKFERVTGVSDVSPMQAHMEFISDKGISEGAGIPQVAVGRVDVAIAESGISLQLQLMPLLASNAEIEVEMLTTYDQFFYDITTMWLPAYEEETFPNADVMAEMSVVCVFDDPMPKNRDAKVQEVVLLDTSGLILKSMVVGELRDLGYKYPTTDAAGNELTDDDIAAMLLDQTAAVNAALDPFSAALAGGDQGATDAQGNPIDPNAPVDQATVDLGVTQ